MPIQKQYEWKWKPLWLRGPLCRRGSRAGSEFEPIGLSGGAGAFIDVSTRNATDSIPKARRAVPVGTPPPPCISVETAERTTSALSVIRKKGPSVPVPSWMKKWSGCFMTSNVSSRISGETRKPGRMVRMCLRNGPIAGGETSRKR